MMSFIEDMEAEGHAVESTCRVLTEHGRSLAPRTDRGAKPTWSSLHAP